MHFVDDHRPAGAKGAVDAAILTRNPERNHDWTRQNCILKAGPPACPAARVNHPAVVLLCLTLAAACTPSAPQQNVQTDTAGSLTADSQDTYFEGSQRVWEAARARGVTFRAVGQEPGWLLEIEGAERIRLQTDYGAEEVVTSLPPAIRNTAARITTYHARTDANDVLITILEEPCVDTMSGERFSRTVDVVLNGTRFRGCGRALDRLP